MIIKQKSKNIYIYIEYNYNKKTDYINLINLENNILNERRNIIYFNNVFYRQVSLFLNDTYIGNVIEPNKYFKNDIGSTAFVIKNSKNFVISVNNNFFILKNSTINIKIDINKYSKISELVKELNNHNINTDFITNGNCKDLLKITDIAINDNNLSVLYENTNNEINTLEILIDDKNNLFVSRNGQTLNFYLQNYIQLNNITLINDININYKNFIKSDINLLNYEIITHNYNNLIKYQLISDKNPHVVLLSAHLLTDIPDKNIDKNSYCISLERLDKIFKYLIDKGYTPIKWEDLINWKINGNNIPKKSFNIMIDDFPVDCYTESCKYELFKKYNIKPGLALVIPVSGNINDEIKIDDILIDNTFNYQNNNYTRSEIINIIKSEYFLANHTDHSKLTTKINKSNLITYFKNAIKNNVTPDVIVYPFGDTNDLLLDLIKNLNIFKIGIDIDRLWYISNAINNYNLFRYSITKKNEIKDILNKIDS